MTTLLVANRGEIARRIFRTARRMGMGCIAVYSDADAGAPFVKEADQAVRIGPAPAAESYLRMDRIAAAAKEAGAGLVHPGYGFLAENHEFAQACADAGLVFVGPPAEVLRAMGSKENARRIAAEAGVAVNEGYSGDDQTDGAFAQAADRIGYPVIVKPAEGGGGKGMSIVRNPRELAEAFPAARRIALAAFGDDRLLLERFVVGARHIEVQIVADSHGNVVHLGERDCSLQRRYQKILEESPSPFVDAELRKALTDSAVAIARQAGYVNAGTCEFVVGEDRSFAFLEMNARLQVEHPVTEMVTGIDLVETQLRVAMGERLPFTQEDIQSKGHAVEVRIYAEDPAEDFLPQTGRIERIAWPSEVRVDTGIEEGSEVTVFYDPMLVKLIASGSDRPSALNRLADALSTTEIVGVQTNLAFLRAVLEEPAVVHGEVTTTWLETFSPKASAGAEQGGRGLPQGASGPRGLIPHRREGPAKRPGGRPLPYGSAPARTSPPDPWAALGPWRLGGRAAMESVAEQTSERIETVGPSHMHAPLPGKVVAVNVSDGERVKKGAVLVVVEAMKMEHAIRAPADGVVTAVACSAGDQVDRGQTLVDFEPA
jgi:acetyl/propionyl-CoA carboxylase alpha subunit